MAGKETIGDRDRDIKGDGDSNTGDTMKDTIRDT